MDARAGRWLGLVLLLIWAASAPAQELVWRPAKAADLPPAAPQVVLCRPVPLVDNAVGVPPPVARAQAPEIPPPPPPSVVPVPPTMPPGLAGPTPYNCGQVNSNGDLTFWGRCGERLKHCWSDMTGAAGGLFAAGQGRNLFQSDHTLDFFASPVSNPFYTEDPRA